MASLTIGGMSRRRNAERITPVKKVRYVIGAFGVAPTLVLMMPTANAMSAVTHTTGKASKTVALEHSKTASPTTTTATTCSFKSSKTATLGSFAGTAFYSGECFHRIRGHLNIGRNSLSMRTRLYSINGLRNFQNFVGGSQPFSGGTFFFTDPNKVDEKACEALVSIHSREKVIYGPVCEII